VHAADALQTYLVNQPIGKVLKPLRAALAAVELEVAGEISAADILDCGPPDRPSRILLVDCPLLDFEALALDRASAVFLPLHLLVAPSGSQTRISVVNPAGLYDARLPAGAANPMDRLLGRLAMAIDAVVQKAGANYPGG
jgi:hypothetical protein